MYRSIPRGAVLLRARSTRSQSTFQGFDFLHENHIFHSDFLDQNADMNQITNTQTSDALSLGCANRTEPSVIRCALYDFGNPSIYFRELPQEKIRETEFFNFDYRQIPFSLQSNSCRYHQPWISSSSSHFILFHFALMNSSSFSLYKCSTLKIQYPSLGPFFCPMVDDNSLFRKMISTYGK